MASKGYLTLKLPLSVEDKIPREAKELARERTKFLLARLQYRPLTDLLADAWLQGIRDGAQASGQLSSPEIQE